MNRESSPLPTVVTGLTWGLFGAAVAFLALAPRLDWTWEPVLRVDGLTQVMAVVVTFVSGIVQSFSRRYMAGGERLQRFYAEIFGLTLVVLALTAADHLWLFVGLWTLMGWMLASLIGHVRSWPQAQAASRFARRSFLGGSAALAVAVAILTDQTGAVTLSGVLGTLGTLSPTVLLVVATLVLVAAMVQSALVPFHRWLLSSMTAPTPVSAFMHAGLVNAGGILLARFAPVVFEISTFMLVLVVAGGLSALVAQAWMQVQTDVKRQLGCSTVAQMSFMVMQCGLGYVPAAITHLILHGFYKAYLFLGSGSVVEHKRPESAPDSGGSGLLSGGVALLTGLAGGVLFATLTGKSLTALGSGALLVFFVVVAVLHATRSIVRRSALSPAARLMAVPAAVLPALGAYALVYNGVKGLLEGLPMAVAPVELSLGHGVVAILFLLVYAAMELGWHRSSPRLYVTLLNTSQPLASTVLTRREEYRAN
jgi:NAD(P)H-quinone oxidoreductase subunit 5